MLPHCFWVNNPSILLESQMFFLRHTFSWLASQPSIWFMKRHGPGTNMHKSLMSTHGESTLGSLQQLVSLLQKYYTPKAQQPCPRVHQGLTLSPLSAAPLPLPLPFSPEVDSRARNNCSNHPILDVKDGDSGKNIFCGDNGYVETCRNLATTHWNTNHK